MHSEVKIRTVGAQKNKRSPQTFCRTKREYNKIIVGLESESSNGSRRDKGDTQ